MPTTRSKAQKEGFKGQTSPNGTLRHLKPGTDYPLYLPLEPSSVLPGMPWAQKHGYAHVQRVSRTDAQVILDTLKLPDDDASGVFFALTAGNPWRWLEAFAKAEGDFARLNIKCRK